MHCKTALMYASREGHTSTVELLIEKGANLEATSKDGGTALTIAQRNGHPDVVRLLQAAQAVRAAAPATIRRLATQSLGTWAASSHVSPHAIHGHGAPHVDLACSPPLSMCGHKEDHSLDPVYCFAYSYRLHLTGCSGWQSAAQCS